MTTKALSRLSERMPSVFDDFFSKPWNEMFNGGTAWGRTLTVPAANITEHKNEYLISLAVPDMKKEDFKIDVDAGMITISSEKEDSNEEKDKKFTRKEYNYSSFSRSFALPEDIVKEKIEAKYEGGVLKVILPRREEAKSSATKISVK